MQEETNDAIHACSSSYGDWPAGDPAVATMGERVYLVYPTMNGHLAQAARSTSAAGAPHNAWSCAERVTVNGGSEFRTGSFGDTMAGVTLAVGWDSTTDQQVLYGLFVQEDNTIDVYRLQPGTADWIRQDLFALTDLSAIPTVLYPPSMAFLPYWKFGVGPGRLFVWFDQWDPRNKDPQRTDYRLLVSFQGARQVIPSDLFTQRMGVDNWQDGVPEADEGVYVGVSLYYDWRTWWPGLRGVRMGWQEKPPACGGTSGYYLRVYPYADGEMDLDMRDYSDFELMRVSVPRSLWAGLYCNDFDDYEGCCTYVHGTELLRMTKAECSAPVVDQ